MTSSVDLLIFYLLCMNFVTHFWIALYSALNPGTRNYIYSKVDDIRAVILELSLRCFGTVDQDSYFVSILHGAAVVSAIIIYTSIGGLLIAAAAVLCIISIAVVICIGILIRLLECVGIMVQGQRMSEMRSLLIVTPEQRTQELQMEETKEDDIENAMEPQEKVCSAEDTEMMCAITHENFKEGDIVIETQCGHVFKKDGLVEWLKYHNTCPMCRYVFPESYRRKMGIRTPVRSPTSRSDTQSNRSATPSGIEQEIIRTIRQLRNEQRARQQVMAQEIRQQLQTLPPIEE